MIAGAHHFKGLLDYAAQVAVRDLLLGVLVEAPLARPTMPGTGAGFRCLVSAAGRYGFWANDEAGYHYRVTHPTTRRNWPAIPAYLVELADEVADLVGARGGPFEWDNCGINVYQPGCDKLGLHVDRTEQDREAPIVTISLGSPCDFKIGGLHRDDTTETVVLESGDVFVLGGLARLAHHEVARVRPAEMFGLPIEITGVGSGLRMSASIRRVRR